MVTAPKKTAATGIRKTEPDYKKLQRELAALEKAFTEQAHVHAERFGEYDRLIAALNEGLASQRAAVQALKAESHKSARVIKSFIGRDLSWLTRIAVTRGPRIAYQTARDYFLLKSSGQFDPVFYARQVGNDDFSDAKLLRDYLSAGYKRGFDPTPAFSVDKYLAIYPDVFEAKTDPFSHYLRCGKREYRLAPPSARARLTQGPADKPAVKTSEIRDGADGLVDYFNAPAAGFEAFDNFTFTNLMAYVWSSRMDLQTVLDVRDYSGRFNFGTWFVMEAREEYHLPAAVFPEDLLYSLKSEGGAVRDVANDLLKAQGLLKGRAPTAQKTDTFGANLVGYAYGEFGMGEHVREVARAVNTTDTPFVIINQNAAGHGNGDMSVRHWVRDDAPFNINVFHVNADIFPFLYFNVGEAFFEDRYNIGYWAWELEKAPPEFDLALNIVDEVWAISEFVSEAFRSRAKVPVVTMPLAVSVPEVDAAKYTKAYYGLPQDAFTFLFIFDAASHLDRKNPIAAVRAFRAAFPSPAAKAHLLLKAMNVGKGNSLWQALLDEIGDDPRITIMQQRLTRDEVLGLYHAADAFISLHRSEGFGRCIAEAMAYGRPVVVTNYSGTLDFAHEGTACVVDYKLVPIPRGAYLLANEQVWADPDITHAAQHMLRLAEDADFRETIAKAGQRCILDNFNLEVTGARYAARLAELEEKRKTAPKKAIKAAVLPASATGESGIIGNIDSPTAAEADAISDILSVQGWIIAPGGIERLELYIDEARVGEPHYGILRPDVHAAHPDIINSGRSGFFFQTDVTKLARGPHVSRLVAFTKDGQTREWRSDFTYIGSVRYDHWMKTAEALSVKQGAALKKKAKKLVTVAIIAGADSEPEALQATLASIAAQTYTRFEIVVAGDGPPQTATGYRWIGHTPDIWQAIARRSRGDVVIVLDAGDSLLPWALAYIGAAFETAEKPEFVYADEDSLLSGKRTRPRFKPGWSPYFLAQSHYIGKPWSVARPVLAEAAGDILSEHGLLKAIAGKAKAVAHIPNVLCSRPLRSIAPEGAPALPVVHAAGPRVSVIIPTCLRHLDIIERCFQGLTGLTAYNDIEVILVTNNLSDPAEAEAFLKRWPFKVVHWEGEGFNWSALNNFGTRHATGDYLLYFNDDVESIKADWLDRLVLTLEDSKAGVIGPMLRYPNRTMQHLGINLVPYGGGARHLFRFCSGLEDNLRWIMDYPREVSAVTGACLLTTRALFDALDGFDESIPVVCNDVDFCLRAQAKGYSILIEPRAELTHHEGISRTGISETEDVKRFWGRWGATLKQPDRFSNPNLDTMRDDWMVNPDISRIEASR